VTRQAHIRDKLLQYTFVLPALIFLVGFVAYPMLYNVVMGFEALNLGTLSGTSPFVGFDNYRNAFDHQAFSTAFWNTIVFTVLSIVFQFWIGFGLAILFSKEFRGAALMRGLILMGWMLPMLVKATIWKWLFAGNEGVLNYLFQSIGLFEAPVLWLTQGGTAMLALIVTNVWVGIPFNMLLLAGGLITLPTELYEAATIDGAKGSQKFLHITLPLMRPTMLSVVILGVIYTYKVFELAWVLTGGGPMHTTELLATLSYKLSFQQFEFGLGAAVANILFLMLLLVGAVYLRLVSREETYV
jgi:multiple sugar transport system permease protein